MSGSEPIFIKMDEKVKGSAKQILELIGQAIFSAQLMEKELAFLIMFPEVAKNKELPTIERMSQEIEKLNKCTFGQLLKKLQNHCAINDKTAKILDEALKMRNLLVHSFFHSHYGWPENISEQGIMRNELNEMRDIFRLIYDILYRESYRNLKNIGLVS